MGDLGRERGGIIPLPEQIRVIRKWKGFGLLFCGEEYSIQNY
jgi:hypothetical protein